MQSAPVPGSVPEDPATGAEPQSLAWPSDTAPEKPAACSASPEDPHPAVHTCCSRPPPPPVSPLDLAGKAYKINDNFIKMEHSMLNVLACRVSSCLW